MSAGYMDQIDVRLTQFTVVYGIFQFQTARQMLGAADTDLDQEIRSHCLLHSCDGHSMMPSGIIIIPQTEKYVNPTGTIPLLFFDFLLLSQHFPQLLYGTFFDARDLHLRHADNAADLLLRQVT